MNSCKILYLDTPSNHSKACLHHLIEKGYAVKYVHSGKEALIECTFKAPDLLIFDYDLESENGFEAIKNINELTGGCKTILYSSRISPELISNVIALKIDGFVLKENSFISLDNQIKLLKIKTENTAEDDNHPLFYNLGNNFIYELNTFFILNKTEKIPLTNQEAKLIDELIKSNGEYISNEQLQNSIGKDELVSIDTLRTVVRKIRKKTYGDIIHNQSGHGYKINLLHDISIEIPMFIHVNKHSHINVLIIKGEKQLNDQIAYHLNKFGIECESAYTKEQAKELIKHTYYDYIITDVDLPDGEGTDLVRELRNSKKIKFIILSDSSDVHYKEYLYFKGIVDYIIHTQNTEYLAQTIYKTIDKIESNTTNNQILLIEKSKKIYEQIKDILLPRNYCISYINDISQAYEIIRSNQFSLVICDIEFPQLFQTIANVRYDIDNLLPFMMLIKSSQSHEIVREAYKNGANECLDKPILPEEFILKVDHLVEQHKVIRELIEQKKLLESYKDIIDQTTLLSKTDPSGIITYANDMFCNISKYSKEELIGQPHSIVRHPDMPAEFFEKMWHTIQSKKIWHGIIKNRNKYGEDYLVKTYILPVLNNDGEIEEYIALRTEITQLLDNNKGDK